MRTMKIAALVAALSVAGALGAAFAPPVRGQAAAPKATPQPRVSVLGSRASEIGVSVTEVEEADAKGGKGPTAGALVSDVIAGSPAEAAGIRKGDVITDFDGERVRSARQLSRLVQETPAGRKVQAGLWRDGQKLTVPVEPRAPRGFSFFRDSEGFQVLEDLSRDLHRELPEMLRVVPAPPLPPAAPAPPRPPAPPAPPNFDAFVWRSGNALGVSVTDLSQQLAQYFGVKEGVLVTSVDDDTAAAKAGIKAGDVIVSINSEAVVTASELRRRVQRLQAGDEFALGIVRDRKALTLKGKFEERRRTIVSVT